MFKKAEILFASFTIFIAGAFYYMSGAFPLPRSRDVGMAFYPRVLSIIIIVLSILIIIQALRKKQPEKSERVDLFDTKDNGLQRVLLLIALTLIYPMVLGFAGFLVLTPIYLILLMIIIKAGKISRIILFSLITSLLIYVIFQRMLKIPLPTGIFYN